MRYYWPAPHRSTPQPKALDTTENPKVGELYDHRGRKVRIVRARPPRPFGFAPGQTREGD